MKTNNAKNVKNKKKTDMVKNFIVIKLLSWN